MASACRPESCADRKCWYLATAGMLVFGRAYLFRRPAGRATTGRGNGWTKARVCSFRSHHGIAVYRQSEWGERGEITLEAAARIMDVSIMTALRMVRRDIIKGRQLCRGAPWVIKAEDLAAYREQRASRYSLTSDPAQQSFQFQ